MRVMRRSLLGAAILGTAVSLALGQDEAVQKDPWAAVRNPTLITLELKNALWREAFLALNEASSGQLHVPETDPEYSLPISMEFRDVPFLKALDMIRSIATISYSTDYAGPTFTVNWSRDNEFMDHVAYLGPARLALKSYAVARSFDFSFHSSESQGQGGQASTSLSMQLTLEPRVRVDAVAVQLTEMTDDTGRNLLAQKNGDPPYGTCREEWPRAFSSNSLSVRTGIPSENAKTIESIKGKLVLSIRPDLPPMRIDLTKEDQQLEMRDGLYRLASVEANGDGLIRITFTPPDDSDGYSGARAFRQARLSDTEMKNHIQIPRASFKNARDSSRDSPYELELRFAVPKGFQPAFLALSDQSQSKDFEYQFEFPDVRLPLLEPIYFQSGVEALAGIPKPAEPVQAAPTHLLTLEELAGSSFAPTEDFRSPAKSPHIQSIGPLRFELTECQFRSQSGTVYRNDRWLGDPRMCLVLKGQVLVDPCVLVVQQGATVEACRADDNSDLLGLFDPSYVSPAHRTLNDPRLTRPINVTSNRIASFSVALPLKERPIPKRITEMTLYYFLTAAEKEQTIEIAEPQKAAIYDIEGSGRLRWAGLRKMNSTFFCFRIDLDGSIRDGETHSWLREFRPLDAEGAQIQNMRPDTGGLDRGWTTMRCYSDSNRTPAKVILKVPAGLKTYAGTVTFKDIELPEIPELPE